MTLPVRLAALIPALTLLAAAAPGQTRNQGKLAQQLVGSYKLISYISYDEKGGETKMPYTVGQISYDRAGRMSANLMRGDRARITGSPASEAERATAYSGYISYFGSYTVDEAQRTVTHHVEGAMNPNMVGSNLVRHVEFSPDGGSLFLSVKSGDRVTGRLRWDRHK
jgi:hypothetical protein